MFDNIYNYWWHNFWLWIKNKSNICVQQSPLKDPIWAYGNNNSLSESIEKCIEYRSLMQFPNLTRKISKQNFSINKKFPSNFFFCFCRRHLENRQCESSPMLWPTVRTKFVQNDEERSSTSFVVNRWKVLEPSTDLWKIQMTSHNNRPFYYN